MPLDDRQASVAPLIDGVECPSSSERLVEVINPSNGRHAFSIPAGCSADVDRSVASCRRAFENAIWSQAPPAVRKQVLHRLADLIAHDSARLDLLDAEEMGKPVSEQRANAAEAARLMRFYAEAVDKTTGEVYRSDNKTFVSQRRIPRGVVAAIVPWNFPTFNAVLKLAPALAAGNSVVLKPSELSSRSALRLARLALESGLPTGVLNVVPGLGEIVGKALALHPDVDMVTFTGSTGTGKLMLQYAGQSNMKPVLAECGGKSAHIIFADGVDLRAASTLVAQSLLTNQGQVCSVGSRLLVERSVEEGVLQEIASVLQTAVIGDAVDPRTTFGPLASATQCGRVMHYIDTAVRDGADLVLGGTRVLTETGGYFVEPTVFRGVSYKDRIAQDEIFGPVLCVIPFDTEEDAARIANGTLYGLMAYVWTADMSRGLRMANAIQSSVMINAAVPSGEGPGHACAFEPTRESGIGTEGGVAGMESYLRRQMMWINYA
jgi:acyl-CoA reductase-like NAD-dependent aldehyde dehydrogenase